MTDTEIETLLCKTEGESPLTEIDGIAIESEDMHFVYRVAKQTQFEATAEQGVSSRSRRRSFTPSST